MLSPRTSARSPTSRARSETVGGASPRSASVIGLIRSRMIRPAPECVGAFVGDAEPVSRNRAGRGSRSTARRTQSQTAGRRCHSSRRMGSARRVSRSGLAASRLTSAGSSRASRVAARRVAVAVFPTARGPSIAIAGSDCSRSLKAESRTRPTYSIDEIPFCWYQTLPFCRIQRYLFAGGTIGHRAYRRPLNPRSGPKSSESASTPHLA